MMGPEAFARVELVAAEHAAAAMQQDDGGVGTILVRFEQAGGEFGRRLRVGRIQAPERDMRSLRPGLQTQARRDKRYG
jgi:hypothetical protein